jgi:hypothetical protein
MNRKSKGDLQFTQNKTRELLSAARVLGARLLILNVPIHSDVAAAFSAIIEQQAGALLLKRQCCLPAGTAQSASIFTPYKEILRQNAFHRLLVRAAALS